MPSRITLQSHSGSWMPLSSWSLNNSWLLHLFIITVTMMRHSRQSSLSCLASLQFRLFSCSSHNWRKCMNISICGSHPPSAIRHPAAVSDPPRGGSTLNKLISQNSYIVCTSPGNFRWIHTPAGYNFVWLVLHRECQSYTTSPQTSSLTKLDGMVQTENFGQTNFIVERPTGNAIRNWTKSPICGTIKSI